MRSQVDMFFVVFLYFVFFLFLYFVFDIPYFTSDAYNIRPAHMRSQVDVFFGRNKLGADQNGIFSIEARTLGSVRLTHSVSDSMQHIVTLPPNQCSIISQM